MRVRIPLNAPSRVHRLMARHSIETGLATYSLGRNPFNRQPSSPARATTLFAPRRRSPTRPPRSHRFDSCSPLHLCGGSSTVEHLIETRGFITQAQTLSLAQPNKPYTHRATRVRIPLTLDRSWSIAACSELPPNLFKRPTGKALHAKSGRRFKSCSSHASGSLAQSGRALGHSPKSRLSHSGANFFLPRLLDDVRHAPQVRLLLAAPHVQR